MCVLYIYIINVHSNTHILSKQKLLFWMRLVTINRLTALVHCEPHLSSNKLHPRPPFEEILVAVYNKMNRTLTSNGTKSCGVKVSLMKRYLFHRKCCGCRLFIQAATVSLSMSLSPFIPLSLTRTELISTWSALSLAECDPA